VNKHVAHQASEDPRGSCCRIHALGFASRQQRVALPGRLVHTVAELETLVDAIVAGDPDAAFAAMRAYLVRVRADLRRSPEPTVE
jgi:DNA-binding FadR family transcriptional regulator